MNPIGKISTHSVSFVFEKVKGGLLPLLSKAAIKNIRYDQEHCLSRINSITKGTIYESRPIAQIVQSAANDLSMAHLYNYASQACNNDFFLSSLTAHSVDIPPLTQSKIQTDFGSFDKFKSDFSNHAEFLFGNGWTWLIRNEEGKLQILNTTNAASPVHHPSIPRKDPISMPSLLGQKVYTRIPLACLNMWQHSYLLDFGMEKMNYVNAFYGLIDWYKIDSILSNEHFHERQFK